MLPSSLCHKLAKKTEHSEIRVFFHNRKAAPKEKKTFGLLIHNEDKEKQHDDLPLVSGISPLQLDVGKNVVDARK